MGLSDWIERERSGPAGGLVSARAPLACMPACAPVVSTTARAPAAVATASSTAAMPALAGDLRLFRAFDVCQLLGMAEATGVLELRAPGVSGEIDIEAGRIVGGIARPQPRRLGRVLCELGAMTPGSLAAALAAAAGAARRVRLGELLVARDAITPAQLDDALARQAETGLAALLILPAGRFTFRSGPLPSGRARLAVDAENLVLAALARIDELRAGENAR